MNGVREKGGDGEPLNEYENEPLNEYENELLNEKGETLNENFSHI